MKRAVIRFYIVLFSIAICLPYLFWLVFGSLTDTENHENRELASFPALTWREYGTFSNDFEQFFNDRLPFRNSLITMNEMLDYYLFRRSANPNVLIGKNDWLFYASTIDGASIADYQGTNLFSQEQLQAIALRCLQTQQTLAERGTEFVLFIAPNKERVYAEMMPDWCGKPAENYRALQLVEYLRENTDIRVVYPYEELMRGKEAFPDCLLYYKTDTHWNNLGAYIGSTALLEELGIEMPPADSETICIEETAHEAGDLADMMDLKRLLSKKEKGYTVQGYETHGSENLVWEESDLFTYRARNADERKIYICKDSFCLAMADCIGSQFSESHMRHRTVYSYDDLAAFDPDVFVYETVERYVGILENFDIGS